MPKDNELFSIEIGGETGFDGFMPSYFENNWAYYGNRNQFNDLVNIDLTDHNVITQGAGVVDLTGGTQAGELGSVLIVSILKHAVASGVTYACGANKVFKITPTAVSNGSFPLTITGGTYQVSTDLLYYKSAVYVFWNDTGTEGEIAKVTLPSTIDSDFGSTVPATGAAHLQDAPHYGIVGGDDVMYITNGRYIAKYKGSTDVLTVQGLDFHENSESISLSWNHNRVLAAVNRPNITGSNFNQSAIYRWNGISSSWEGDPIEVSGEIGALYTKNGRTFVWWKEVISTGGYSFGWINGGVLDLIRRYKGSLPNQAQVGEYEGFVSWVSNNKLMLWGAKDSNVPVKMFQYISPKYATMGGWAAPFGVPLLASYAGANYSLAKANGYTVTSNFKTKAFKMSGAGYKAQIDEVFVEFETLASGAKCDFTIYYNKGASNKALTQVAYSATNASTVRKILNESIEVEDFQLKGDFAEGSVSNPVKIRSILINGHFVSFD